MPPYLPQIKYSSSKYTICLDKRSWWQRELTVSNAIPIVLKLIFQIQQVIKIFKSNDCFKKRKYRNNLESNRGLKVRSVVFLYCENIYHRSENFLSVLLEREL